MEENNQNEIMSMTIIANSGECRAKVFDALRLVRDAGDYEGAKKLLDASFVTRLTIIQRKI